MEGSTQHPEMRKRFHQAALDNGLVISRWFGEDNSIDIYNVEPYKKPDALLVQIQAIEQPGTYLIFGHTGMNTPEMAVLKDLNPHGLDRVAEHRAAETRAFCDERIKALIREREYELVGYKVFREKFPDQMDTP